MDCIRVRCAQIFYDYRALIITKKEFNKRIEEIKDEVETKQLNLTLDKKEEKS